MGYNLPGSCGAQVQGWESGLPQRRKRTMNAQTRRQAGSVLLAVLLLAGVVSAAQASEYRLVRVTVDPDNKLNATRDVGAEKSVVAAGEGNFTWTQTWRDGGKEIASYTLKIKFDRPPDVIVSNTKFSLSLTVSATANGLSKERPTQLEGRFDVPGGSLAAATAGQPPANQPFVGEAKGNATYKIRDHMRDFDIVATASLWGPVTVYHYDEFETGEDGGTTKPPATTTPTTPTKPPAATTPPTIWISLGSLRYSPGERFIGLVSVRTGTPPASAAEPASIYISVMPDPTASPMPSGLTLHGKEFETAPPRIIDLTADRFEVTTPEDQRDLSRLTVIAPHTPGAYRLVASLATLDKRTTYTYVSFEVVGNARRVTLSSWPGPFYVKVGETVRLTVMFSVSGYEPGKAPAKADASCQVHWNPLPDARTPTSGPRPTQYLPDLEAPLQVNGPIAFGEARWMVPCNEPGLLRVRYTVGVGSGGYGWREAQTWIVVRPTTAGGATTGTSQPPRKEFDAEDASALTLPNTGVTLKQQDGQIVIATVTPGAWASQMAIEPGWVLTQVDDQSVAGLTLAQVKALLSPADKPFVMLGFTKPGGAGAARIMLPVEPR